jgi:uncharacterized protein involved in outer membrane biogenesis
LAMRYEGIRMNNRFGTAVRRLRSHRWLTVTLLTLLILTVVCVAILSITNWNFARGTVAGYLSGKLDRPVRIDGSLSARLLSSQPSVSVEKLSVGNPQWIDADDLATVDALKVAIELRELIKGNLVLATLEITNPNVTVVSNDDGRNNFNFSKNETETNNDTDSKRPIKLPAIRNFTLRGGDLHVRDAVRKLSFDGKVEASEQNVSPQADPFRLRGNGTLNGEPFALQFKGGPLANIRMDEPYEFDADVKAGKTHGTARGAFTKPFDFARLVAMLDIKGENLAHLYHLTDLALPFTPPYRIAGELQSLDGQILVRKLNGKVGNSDLNGDVTVDLNSERPKLTARLRSKSLNLADLSTAFGKGVASDPETGGALDSVAPGTLPPDKLFPTYRFEFDRLRSMDADVKLHADSIQARAIPFQKVAIHLKLDSAVLTLNPVVFSLPQGDIAATARIDAREATAKSTIDLRINDVMLSQFKGKSAPPLEGVLQARLQLTGSGNSVDDVAATADGQFSAVVPHGEIRQAFAELTGINVARGLGLLLGDDQTKMDVRCGVAVLRLQQGNAAVERITFDTETVTIEGKGSVNLADETLKLEIDGKPKKVRLVRLDTPVTLEGPIRKPNIGIDKSDTAKQVGIAGAIATLLTPITAALAFIDPGLAKDENCAALIAATEQVQQQPLQKPAAAPTAPPAPK